MNIDHLRLFIRLASTHNISQAGAELGLSPAVASAHINKLEESVGVRLVHRTTRKVSLTQEGEAFLPQAENVVDAVDIAKQSVGGKSALPSGVLRVTAPSSFGRMHLIPAMKSFTEQYPELSVDLRFSDSIVDLVDGGFDVAIRNAELKDSSLIAKKLASDRRIICASPAYLKQYGTPKHPNDLKDHQCINIIGIENWLFNVDDKVIDIKTRGKIRTDNGDAIRELCVAGHGITMNSMWSVYQQIKSGELIEILTDTPYKSDTAIWVLYPSSRFVAPKVRAFIDFFSDYFGEPPYWDH
ncbi:LysR family transcriptional regulator [Vibrio ulleungensis]|uniref:LysR family transcriptional regulator n=1 Tax=Vibrio ulleungensis TaxID=2807619 RepID=A0ABS2HD21_9VIBR|nr:LysR family transcriptional regulator [Vibrio ulleungensis]MBM7034894.1 LysR family transcriptional regulator [Vibrio ulleungensis]